MTRKVNNIQAHPPRRQLFLGLIGRLACFSLPYFLGKEKKSQNWVTFIFGSWLETNLPSLLHPRMLAGRWSSGHVYRALNCVINKCGRTVRVENRDANMDLQPESCTWLLCSSPPCPPRTRPLVPWRGRQTQREGKPEKNVCKGRRKVGGAVDTQEFQATECIPFSETESLRHRQ